MRWYSRGPLPWSRSPLDQPKLDANKVDNPVGYMAQYNPSAKDAKEREKET